MNKNVNLHVQLAVAPVSKYFTVRVTMDSLQHEAHIKIIHNQLHFMRVKFVLFHFFGVS